MTIQFQYTPQLLQSAHELHYKKFYPVRRRIILFFGALALWAGILLLLVRSLSLWYSISLIVYGIFAIAFHFYTIKTTGKRAFRKLKEYHDPFTVIIEEDQLRLTINDQSYTIEWDKIQKALITPEMILLYPSEAVFFVFPRENFSEGNFEEFEKMVRSKVNNLF